VQMSPDDFLAELCLKIMRCVETTPGGGFDCGFIR